MLYTVKEKIYYKQKHLIFFPEILEETIENILEFISDEKIDDNNHKEEVIKELKKNLGVQIKGFLQMTSIIKSDIITISKMV